MILDEEAFKGLTELEDLEMKKNNLIDLPDNIFSDLKSLKSLKLSDNVIDHPPHSLLQTKVKSIDLTGNALTDVKLFGNMQYLKEMKLSRNRKVMCEFEYIDWVINNTRYKSFEFQCINKHKRRIYYYNTAPRSDGPIAQGDPIDETAYEGCGCAINPCENGGKCQVTQGREYTCECTPVYQGTHCDKVKG